MADPVNHSGFEGIVVAAGMDRHVDKWSGSETTADGSSTTTNDYDPASGRCFTRVQKGSTTFEGSFEFPYDSNTEPYPDLRSGSEVPAIFTTTAGKTFNFPKIFIKTIAYDTGGVDNGVGRYTVSFRNQGKYAGPS